MEENLQNCKITGLQFEEKINAIPENPGMANFVFAIWLITLFEKTRKPTCWLAIFAMALQVEHLTMTPNIEGDISNDVWL